MRTILPSTLTASTCALIALSLSTAAPAVAQDDDSNRRFKYTAKFVCKNVTPLADIETDRAFGPGVYRTVLNLHNANRTEPADVVVRVIEAHSIANTTAGDSGRLQRALEPDQAVFVNCRAIQRILGSPEDSADKVDGFVIVRSDRRLDAAAVYSAVTRSPDAPNDGITLDIEHLRASVVRRDGRGEDVEE